jgi:hypothetical protein
MERNTSFGIRFRKYQTVLEAMPGAGKAAPGCISTGKPARPNATCGQGQPFLPQSPPQLSCFWGNSEQAESVWQQFLVSVFISFLQQSEPPPQATAAGTGRAKNTPTSIHIRMMDIKTDILLKRKNTDLVV